MFCQTPRPTTTHVSRHSLILCEQSGPPLPRSGGQEAAASRAANQLKGPQRAQTSGHCQQRLYGKQISALGVLCSLPDSLSNCPSYKVYLSNVESWC